MPAGMTHEQHRSEMKREEDLKKRGAAAMVFDQDKTTHHFILSADGGSIEVAAKTASDAESRDQISPLISRRLPPNSRVEPSTSRS